MWIVDKLHDGLEPDRILIDDVAHKRLMLWYTGAGDEKDEHESVRLVQRIKSQHGWIACDCLGEKKAPPLLAPAYLAMGRTYYLRRLTGAARAEHHKDCPFFRSQLEYQQKLAKAIEGKPLKPAEGYFSILQPLGEHLAQKPDPADAKASSKSPTPPRLARLLWTLLQRAERHIIPPPVSDEPLTIKNEFAALQEAAEGLSIAPKIPFTEHFYIHSRDLVTGAIFRKLGKTEQFWPKTHPAQAFLITYAKTVSRDSIMTADGPLRANEGIDTPAPDPGNDAEAEPETEDTKIEPLSPVGKPSRELVNQGPYLCIVVVGRPMEGGPLQAIRAYAQPIYSGHHFMTVDSNAERELLEILIRLQRRHALTGHAMWIEKPLFDYQTPAGHCRPDFILRFAEDKPIVIELMGYDDPDYQAAKDITHPRMSHIGHLHTVQLAALADPNDLAFELEMVIQRHRISRNTKLAHYPEHESVNADKVITFTGPNGLGVNYLSLSQIATSSLHINTGLTSNPDNIILFNISKNDQ